MPEYGCQVFRYKEHTLRNKRRLIHVLDTGTGMIDTGNTGTDTGSIISQAFASVIAAAAVGGGDYAVNDATGDGACVVVVGGAVGGAGVGAVTVGGDVVVGGGCVTLLHSFGSSF